MAGFGGNANNYQAPESRALSSIAKSPGPDVNTDFVKMISQHDSQIKFLAEQVKQTQKGVSEANQNPIQQIQQFVADLTVLLGGGELPKGALEFGDLQYILPAIGALFGFGDGGFPVNLFAAAEKFFLGYVVPSEQYNDLTIAAINSWGEQLGIDPQFLRDLSALVRAFGDLFSAIQDLLNACGHFISMLFTPDGVDYGPLGMILKPIVSFLGFGWLDLSKVGDAVSWITDGLDPGIRKLVATVNSITTTIVSLTGMITRAETDMVGYAHDQGSALDNAFAQVLQWIGNALGIPGSNAPKVEGIEHAPAISADVSVWTIDADPDNGWSFDGSTTYADNGGSFFTNGNGIAKRLLTQDRLPCFAGQRLTVNDYFQWSNIPHDADAGACVVFYTGSTEIGQTNLPLPNDADSADWSQVGGSVTVPADADGFAVGIYVGANVTSGTVRVGQISTRNWTWINQRQTTAFISYFQNLGHVFDGVDWTSSNALSQMWQGIVNAWIQPIAGWLTPDSPINAANLVGNLFPDGLPMSWLVSTPRNELDNGDFRTAIALGGGTDWRWVDGVYFADSTNTGSAVVTGDGVQHALRSNPIDVVPGKSVSMSVEVLADGLTGTNQPVQLWAVPGVTGPNGDFQQVGDMVLLESAFPSGGDSGWHGAPIGSTSELLQGSYTPSAGVSQVVMRFVVTGDATVGDVYFDHAKAWIVGGWLEQIWDQTTDIFDAFANADSQEEFAAAWNLVLDLFNLPHPENFWTWLVNSFIAPLFGLDSTTAAEIGDDITTLQNAQNTANTAFQSLLNGWWEALTGQDSNGDQTVDTWQSAWTAFTKVLSGAQQDSSGAWQDIWNRLFHLNADGSFDIAGFPSWLNGLNTAFGKLSDALWDYLLGGDRYDGTSRTAWSTTAGAKLEESWQTFWAKLTGQPAANAPTPGSAGASGLWSGISSNFLQSTLDNWVHSITDPIDDFFDSVRKYINQMIEGLHWGYFDENWAWKQSLTTPNSEKPGSDPVMIPGSNDGSGDAISSQYDSSIPPPPTGLLAVPIPFTVANFPAGKITYAIAAVKNGIEGPATKVSVRMDTLFPPNCTGQVNLAWDPMPGYTFKIYREVDATYQATAWRLIASPSTAGTWLSPLQDKTVRTGGTVAHPKTDAELSAQIVTTVKTTAQTDNHNLTDQVINAMTDGTNLGNGDDTSPDRLQQLWAALNNMPNANVRPGQVGSDIGGTIQTILAEFWNGLTDEDDPDVALADVAQRLNEVVAIAAEGNDRGTSALGGVNGINENQPLHITLDATADVTWPMSSAHKQTTLGTSNSSSDSYLSGGFIRVHRKSIKKSVSAVFVGVGANGTIPTDVRLGVALVDPTYTTMTIKFISKNLYASIPNVTQPNAWIVQSFDPTQYFEVNPGDVLFPFVVLNCKQFGVIGSSSLFPPADLVGWLRAQGASFKNLPQILGSAPVTLAAGNVVNLSAITDWHNVDTPFIAVGEHTADDISTGGGTGAPDTPPPPPPPAVHDPMVSKYTANTTLTPGVGDWFPEATHAQIVPLGGGGGGGGGIWGGTLPTGVQGEGGDGHDTIVQIKKGSTIAKTIPGPGGAGAPGGGVGVVTQSYGDAVSPQTKTAFDNQSYRGGGQVGYQKNGAAPGGGGGGGQYMNFEGWGGSAGQWGTPTEYSLEDVTSIVLNIGNGGVPNSGGGQYPYAGQGSWGAGNGGKGACWVRFVQKS